MSAELVIVPPRTPKEQARHLHPAALPRWRALLECEWQHRLELITRFALAFHDAEEHAADPAGGQGSRTTARRHADWMLHQTVAERYALAEIEAALSRLAAGRYGWCELCRKPISAERLARVPQVRYCAACAPGDVAGGAAGVYRLEA